MIINVTLDLGDEYSTDEDNTLADSIKDHIARAVKEKILKDFQDKIEVDFHAKVAAAVKEKKEELIDGIITRLFEEQKIKKAYYSDEKISFAKYIEEELVRSTLNDKNMNDRVSKIVKDMGVEITNKMKERYDLYFAAQVIDKLRAAGLLNEDIAKAITGK